MAKKKEKAVSSKPETVESIKLEQRIDMGQAENIIRQLLKLYGKDQLEDIIRRVEQESVNARQCIVSPDGRMG